MKAASLSKFTIPARLSRNIFIVSLGLRRYHLLPVPFTPSTLSTAITLPPFPWIRRYTVHLHFSQSGWGLMTSRRLWVKVSLYPTNQTMNTQHYYLSLVCYGQRMVDNEERWGLSTSTSNGQFLDAIWQPVFTTSLAPHPATTTGIDDVANSKSLLSQSTSTRRQTLTSGK